MKELDSLFVRSAGLTSGWGEPEAGETVAIGFLSPVTAE